jgi:hypothetical protein
MEKELEEKKGEKPLVGRNLELGPAQPVDTVSVSHARRSRRLPRRCKQLGGARKAVRPRGCTRWTPPPSAPIRSFAAEDKLKPSSFSFLPALVLLCAFSTETLAPVIFRAVAAGRPQVLGVAEEVRLVAYFISREGIREG